MAKVDVTGRLLVRSLDRQVKIWWGKWKSALSPPSLQWAIKALVLQLQTDQIVVKLGSFRCECVYSNHVSMNRAFLKKTALLSGKLPLINERQIIYLYKTNWKENKIIVFGSLEFTGFLFLIIMLERVNVQISAADVWRRKSSHVPDSKQHVINIDISLWQLQTPKFLSVPPQQTQTHRHRQTHTLTHIPFCVNRRFWVMLKACTVVRATLF